MPLANSIHILNHIKHVVVIINSSPSLFLPAVVPSDEQTALYCEHTEAIVAPWESILLPFNDL